MNSNETTGILYLTAVLPLSEDKVFSALPVTRKLVFGIKQSNAEIKFQMDSTQHSGLSTRSATVHTLFLRRSDLLLWPAKLLGRCQPAFHSFIPEWLTSSNSFFNDNGHQHIVKLTKLPDDKNHRPEFIWRGLIFNTNFPPSSTPTTCCLRKIYYLYSINSWKVR